MADHSENSAQMTGAESIANFITGGNATFTLVSIQTGTRYTFKVQTKLEDDDCPFFVRLKTGPEWEDTTYIGFIPRDDLKLIAGNKGLPDAPSFGTLAWFLRNVHMIDTDLQDKVEFWHAGSCCRCGRELTVPESIAAGIGPKCAEYL
jgi:hypothetical protein